MKTKNKLITLKNGRNKGVGQNAIPDWRVHCEKSSR